MILYEDALRLVMENVPVPQKSVVPIEDAAGYVAAEDVVSSIDVVSYRNSAMDGFAVRADWLIDCSSENPVSLPYQYTVFAGDSPRDVFNDRSPVKIMTGAAVQDGYDAVVKFEDTVYDNSTVTFSTPPKINQNIRFPGEDVKRGQILYSAGCRFTQLDIGILAGIGLTTVSIYRKPSIKIATTGNEVIMPGGNLAFGQLYNSNLFTLSSFIKPFARKVNAVEKIDDTTNALEMLLQSSEDIIVTSGGVSAGERDLVVKTAEAQGWQTIFHKIKIKPGKPVYFARRGDQLLFGLPGNPLSVTVTCALFVIPALKKLAGRNDFESKMRLAQIDVADVRKSGRYLIWPGSIKEQGGTPEVVFSSKNSSAALSTVMNTDGLIFQPAMNGIPDTSVDVTFLYWFDIFRA